MAPLKGIQSGRSQEPTVKKKITRKVDTTDFSVVERGLLEAEWLHASLKENFADRGDGDVDCTGLSTNCYIWIYPEDSDCYCCVCKFIIEFIASVRLCQNSL